VDLMFFLTALFLGDVRISLIGVLLTLADLEPEAEELLPAFFYATFSKLNARSVESCLTN
jgi:hypothetical protein